MLIIPQHLTNSLITDLVKGNRCSDVFWIPDLRAEFYHVISPFTPWFYFRLRRYIKHSRQCFTSKFAKKYFAARRFCHISSRCLW